MSLHLKEKTHGIRFAMVEGVDKIKPLCVPGYQKETNKQTDELRLTNAGVSSLRSARLFIFSAMLLTLN